MQLLEVVCQVLQWFDKPSPSISHMLNEINMFLKKEMKKFKNLGWVAEQTLNGYRLLRRLIGEMVGSDNYGMTSKMPASMMLLGSCWYFKSTSSSKPNMIARDSSVRCDM